MTLSSKLSCLSPWRNEPEFFGMLAHSLASKPVDVFSLAISGCMPTEAKLPGLKVSMELDTNGWSCPGSKPPAFTKALENESGRDNKGGPLFLP